MFVCSGCEQLWEDADLRYTMLHQSRLQHPATALFLRRFHHRDCLEMFFKRLERHAGLYILTDLTGEHPVEYGPARPAELRDLLQQGRKTVAAP